MLKTSHNPVDYENKGIILFDGVCNLCNSAVRFIIERDARDHFRFASLQSEIGKKLLKEYKINPEETDSIVFISPEQKAYVHSDAALKIAVQLQGWPRVLKLFKIIPTFLRDRVYKLIASHRYRWFGKKQQCMLPTPHLKQKFID